LLTAVLPPRRPGGPAAHRQRTGIVPSSRCSNVSVTSTTPVSWHQSCQIPRTGTPA